MSIIDAVREAVIAIPAGTVMAISAKESGRVHDKWAER
jgi:hypothetical protein